MAQDSRPATAVSLPRLAKVSSSSKQEGTAAAALTVSEDDDGPQPVKVLIEYCQRCYRHPWCVNHSEERYFSQFMDIAGRISEAFPEVDEIVAVKDPRIGALEVTVVHGQHQQVVFSKLQSDRWPNVAKILERIRRVARRMMSPDPRNTLLIENEFLTPRHHTVEVSLAAETPVPFALGLEITDRPPFLVTVAQEGKYGAECGVARGDVLHCINGKACDRMDLEGLLVELRKRPMRLYCRRFDRTKRRRRAGGAMSFTRLFGRRPASMRAEKATTDHYQRQRKGMTTIDTIPPRPPPSRRLPKPAYQVKRTDRSGEMMGPRLGPVPHPRSAPDQVRNARSKTMEGQRPSGGRRTQPGSEMLLQGERGGPSRHSVKRIGARAASSSLSQKKDLTDTAGDTEESRIEETRPEALAANGTGLAATGGIVQAEEAAPGPVEGAKEASSIDESTGVPKLPVVTDNGSAGETQHSGQNTAAAAAAAVENYYDEDFESDNETWEDEDLPASEQAARATTSSPSVPPVTTKVLEPQLGSNSAPLETQERTEIANADSSVAEAPQESTTVAGHAMATAADMGEPAQSVASSPGPNGGLESLVTGVESIDGDGEEGTPPQEAVVATAANTEEVPERTAGVATEAQVECTEDSSGAEEGTEPHNAGEGPEVDITARDVGQAPASSTGTDHEQGPDAPESVDADVDSRVVLGDDSESTELTAGREADSSANAIATEGIAEAGTPLPETCADGGNGEVAGPGGSETSHAAVDAAEVEGPQAATPALQSEVPEIDDGLEVAGGATQPEAMQPGVEEAPDEVGHDTLSDGAREMISSVVGMVVRQASDRISPTVETAPVVEDPPQAGGSEQAEETKDGYDDDFEEYLPSDEEVPEEPKANAMAREEEVWGGAGDTPRPGNEFESKDQGHDKHRSIDEPNPTSPRKPFRGEHANEAAPLTGVADFPTAEATEERPKASDGESDYDDDFESD